MAFGPRMQFAVGELTILMRPFRYDEAERFLVGMQSQNVIETLGLYAGQTLENEQEYLERLREDKDAIGWAICVVRDDHTDGLAIGCSTLNLDRQRQTASSGSVIFDRQWWRRGIATHAHKARTAFAFNQLGLLALESGFIKGNIGSNKALWRSGYEETGGFQLRSKCVNGVWKPVTHMLCVQPSPLTWEYTWGDQEIPDRFQSARERTRKALDWVHSNVEWP